MQDKYSTGIKDLEVLSNMVYDEQVKDLIKEAIDCYNIGSYRASINLIWTATVYDVYKKIKSLHEIYGEASCKVILETVNGLEKQKSPKWESYIIEELCKKLESINEREKDQLLHIQYLRNHCSHPILYQSEENLFKPSAEEVRASLRSSVEIILSKPLLFGKKSIDIIFSEVSGNYFPRDYEKFRDIFIERFLTKTVSNNITKNLAVICLKKCIIDINTANENVTDEICLNILNTIWNYDKTQNIFDEFRNDIITKIEQVRDDKLPNLIKFLCLNGNKAFLVRGNKLIETKISEFITKHKIAQSSMLEAIFIFGDLVEKCILKQKFEYIHTLSFEDIRDLINNADIKIINILFEVIFEQIKLASNFVDAENTLLKWSKFYSAIKEINLFNKFIESVINNSICYGINQILYPSQSCRNVTTILENMEIEFLRRNESLIQKLLDKLLEINKKADGEVIYYSDYFVEQFNDNLVPVLNNIKISIPYVCKYDDIDC